jgi:hypothetical protein
MCRFKMILCLSAFSLMLPTVAQAECDESEKVRLSGEIKKLAQRNAWTGVERSYAALLNTGCVLNFKENQLGAESARYLGKTWEMYERLAAAKDLDPQPPILESLSGLDANYGRVEIRGDARRRPVLSREAMPFAPDQRKSIEWAIEVVTGTGSFKGMLPLGDYVVGEIPFSVAAGEEFLIVQVGKQKRDKGSGGDRPESEGLVNWAGLVATVGPNFMLTPEPGSPVVDSNGRHQFAPDSTFASGVQLQIGGEIGLTYAAPEAGIAATIGYGGGYGVDTMHQFSGWLAGVVRPGELRIAAGPTWSLFSGSGTGLAQWFDVGHDAQSDPNSGIRYQGYSWGGGGAASVGLGVMDIGDTMKGFVELGGGWTSDGARSFSGFGLRVGIVPAVSRFEG